MDDQQGRNLDYALFSPFEKRFGVYVNVFDMELAT